MGELAFLFPGQGRSLPAWAAISPTISRSARRLRRGRRRPGFSDLEAVLRRPRRSAEAHRKHAAGDPDRFRGGLSRAREAGIEPNFAAGHSLGEYSALVAAGALDFADAVKLVRQRGRYMQEAVPAGEGAMAAILGLRRRK